MYWWFRACEAYLFDTGLYPFATRLQLYPTVTLRNTELRCIFSRLEREGARSDMAHPDPPAATSEYELFGIAFVQRDGGGSPRVARAGREGGEGCGTATAARAAARAALRVMRPTRGESVEGNRTIHYKHEAALVLTERRRPAGCNLLCGCRAPGGVEIIRNTCDYSVYTKGVTEGVMYYIKANQVKRSLPKKVSLKTITRIAIPSRSLQLSKRPLTRVLCVFTSARHRGSTRKCISIGRTQHEPVTQHEPRTIT